MQPSPMAETSRRGFQACASAFLFFLKSLTIQRRYCSFAHVLHPVDVLAVERRLILADTYLAQAGLV